MPSVGETTTKNLAGENRRARRADAPQLNEHLAFVFDGRILCIRCVSFSFRHPQLCFDEVETGIFTLEFGAQTSRKRQSLTVQVRKINARTSQSRLDAANTLPEQQSFNAVDMCGALANQPLAFAMRAACVFFLDGRNTNNGADMPVPLRRPRSAPARASAHRSGRSSPTCPAIDLQTGRIENPAVDLLRLQ